MFRITRIDGKIQWADQVILIRRQKNGFFAPAPWSAAQGFMADGNQFAMPGNGENLGCPEADFESVSGAEIMAILKGDDSNAL